ncbi:MAG: DNA-binding protein [Betaproteobacteria bacterium]|jgi:hypothetical protein
MSTLFVAWQSPSPARAWFPIGRLDAEKDKAFVFHYTRGALDAQKQSGFEPLLSFPDFQSRYESNELFPVFKNRVLDASRKDFAEYLGWLDLDPTHADPIEILGLTGGERQTDSLEVFPKIIKHADRTFSCRFFLHGLRHVSAPAREKANDLAAGSPLRIAVELNNPTGLAIQLQTDDCYMIGWSPRYLVNDLIEVINAHPDVSASVVRVNEFGAPLARRILVELKGRLPAEYEPMSGGQFELITPIKAAPKQ